MIRIIIILLLVMAVACEGFAYWGLNTPAGRAAFDEMAGIIPFAAAPLGLLFAITALVIWWWRRHKIHVQ